MNPLQPVGSALSDPKGTARFRTWSIVIQREHLVVERHGVRTGCSQICECRGLKLRAWDVRIYAGWQYDTQTFVVHEEKRLVFFDGTAKGRSPLVGVVKQAVVSRSGC